MLQPNNAATLLVLGLLGVFWFRMRGLMGEAGTLTAGAFLVFALVLTQSRVGYLSFAILVALGLLFGPKHFGKTLRRPVLLLTVWFVAVLLLLPVINGSVDQGVTLVTRTQGELRGKVWIAFLRATLEHPLAGFGFFPGIAPQVAAADLGHPLPAYFSWAHNAFLDIALWYGIPAAGALLAAYLLGLHRVWRAQLTGDAVLCAGAVLAIGLHGLVELPLGYAYFLLPFALLLGGLSERVQWPALRIDPRAVTATVVVLTASLLVIGHDYLEVEASMYSWRFKLSNVGLHHDLDLPETLLLNQYRAYMIGVRMPPAELDPKELRDFEQSIQQEPSPVALQAVVTAHVAHGQLEEARRWIEVARRVNAPAQRQALALSWRSRAARDQRLTAVQWPE
jgi:hypothetical protein